MSMLQFYDVGIPCKIAKILKKYYAIFNHTNGSFPLSGTGQLQYVRFNVACVSTANKTLTW